MASEKITREEIWTKVKEYLAQEKGVDQDKIEPTTTFTTDLKFDSLDGLELIIDLEEKFGVTIPDKDAEKIHTVKEAVDCIYTTVNP